MVDYLTIDYPMGQSSSDLTAFYNGYGADGWQISSVQVVKSDWRRVVFMLGTPTEYLVVDYDAGKTPQQLTDDLNSYGVDGWDLRSTDLARSNMRRAIFMKTQGSSGGGGDGGVEEAPSDGKTYGRRNAAWNWAVAHDNDVMDGGTF